MKILDQNIFETSDFVLLGDDADILGFRVKTTWFGRAYHGVCQSGAWRLSFTYHSMEGARSPWSLQKVLYWGEKVGCIKGIGGLYRIGAGSLEVKFLNGDLGWWLPMAPQWPSN